jgi:hypothetical protein
MKKQMKEYKIGDKLRVVKVNRDTEGDYVGFQFTWDESCHLYGHSYYCIETNTDHIHAVKLEKVKPLKKTLNKKICNHNLVLIDHFTRQKRNGSSVSVEPIKDIYRFICIKPNCLVIIDVTKK